GCGPVRGDRRRSRRDRGHRRDSGGRRPRRVSEDWPPVVRPRLPRHSLLPAPIIEHLPGPSLMKWRAYAVLTNAAAAIALGRLCLVLGLSSRGAGTATWIAAFGFGPMQSVFDPYTSDPVMYLLAPLMMADLMAERLGRPTLLGSLGVISKEFTAAPLWIYALFSAMRRRWDTALKAALGA